MQQMSRMSARILAIAAALVLASCSGDSSTSPGSAIAGTWKGSISSNVAGVGNGNLTVTFVQSGENLSGTWSTTFSNASNNNSGSLAGNVVGSQVAVTLTPSIPSTCPYNVAGAISGITISGTYAAFNCTVAASGAFSVTKQ